MDNIQNSDVLNSIGKLNFAFCPSYPLNASVNNENLNFNLNEIILNSGQFTKKEQSSILSDSKFFYICYSISIDQMQNSIQDYFYFQTFTQCKNINIPSIPVYGFFAKNEIISLIREIDYLFEPEAHDKQIFSEYLDSVGTCSLLIKAMQNWTEIKLNDFIQKIANSTKENNYKKTKNSIKQNKKANETGKTKSKAKTKTKTSSQKKEQSIRKTSKSNRIRKSKNG